MSQTHTLKNTKDGGTVEILDDGPFPSDGKDFRAQPPSIGRQRLLAMLKKTRAPIPELGEEGDEPVPCFVPVTDLSEVFDPRAGAFLPPTPLAAPVSPVVAPGGEVKNETAPSGGAPGGEVVP